MYVEISWDPEIWVTRWDWSQVISSRDLISKSHMRPSPKKNGSFWESLKKSSLKKQAVMPLLTTDCPFFFFLADLSFVGFVPVGDFWVWCKSRWITLWHLKKCTYGKYDLRVSSQKPHKKHKSPNKHHHHGGGAANPCSGVDLMNPRRPRGGQPSAIFSQCRYRRI